MNKIKLMYDVVRRMKDKEAVKGSIKVEANKNETKFFGFENQFEKNISKGRGKASFSTEMDCNGRSFRHESSTEFDMCEGHKHMHHGFMGHGHVHEHMRGGHGFGGFTMKDKLNKLALVLSIFDAVKAEEKEDQSFILSLNTKDIPEDLKKELKEEMHKHHEQMKGMHDERHHEFGNEEHHFMLKELRSMENHNLDVQVYINRDYEIEKAVVLVTGQQKSEQGEVDDIKLTAELKLQ